jgi:hypothetical protein
MHCAVQELQHRSTSTKQDFPTLTTDSQKFLKTKKSSVQELQPFHIQQDFPPSLWILRGNFL